MSTPACPRSLYVLPWRGTNGETLLVGVGADGRRLFEVALRADLPYRLIEPLLWQILDAEDPPGPVLALLA